MKRIINVYKDRTLWQTPPPGIGDFLRGSAALYAWTEHGPWAGQFDVSVNFQLSPARAYLDLSGHAEAPEADLAAAQEFFEESRDGDVRVRIEEFLASSQDTLTISTNVSWGKLSDIPPRTAMDRLAQAIRFTPELERMAAERRASIGGPFTLLHVRDKDRSNPADNQPGSAERFRARARIFVAQVREAYPDTRLVCISNNEGLRDTLCEEFDLIDSSTAVGNPGFAGTLTQGELLDMALIRDAEALYALSYFSWNSGFSVWTSRIYGTWAQYFNATTPL